ncbi:MAG: 2OG-Fe(II) oxygenase family protein [Dongiaceae bacterium]
MPDSAHAGNEAAIAAKRIAFSEIPVVDIGPMFGPDRAGRLAVAKELRRCCSEVGFMYIKNHGVREERMICAREQMAEYFHRPLEYKLQHDIMHAQRHRGFVRYGGLYADVSAKPDHQEAFEVALELPENDPDYLAGNMIYGPNIWPEDMPDFRKHIYAYYDEILSLGRVMFRAFALALDLEETWFEPLIDKPMGQLRLIYYPPQEGPIDPQRIGIGAHSDYECFTILWQDGTGGLQVQNIAGEWIEATPVPGTFIINIGDMMARWTNGLFSSTPHRVINRSGKERYSMPFFYGASYDTVASCVPSLLKPGEKPKFPPTKCGYWTEMNNTAAYEYRRAFRETGKVPNPELSGDVLA